MKRTDDELLTLLVDQALGAIEDGDAGAELERLGVLHPHLRRDLYTAIVRQQQTADVLAIHDARTARMEQQRAELTAFAIARKAERLRELRRERIVGGVIVAVALVLAWWCGRAV